VRAVQSVARDQAMAFRYDQDTVALLLPHLGVIETEAVVGQLREVLEPIAVEVTAGIAQAGPSGDYEPEDAATEWINRLSRALALAATIAERLCTLPPAPASIA